MRKIVPAFLVAVTLLFAVTGTAQKIKILEGAIKPLKTEQHINIEYTYDPKMTVGKMSEQDYIAKRKAEMNSKEAGKGDQWAASWVSDRTAAYEPKFTTLFTENARMDLDATAKYTLIFNTISTEPGYNVGVWRGNAYIDAVITITETANRNNILAVIRLEDARGKMPMGSDFATSWRVAECYAKAGKELAKFIRKK